MPDVAAAKHELRNQVLARRRKLTPIDLQQAAVGLREVLLEVPEVTRAATVAVYVSVGSEPGTGWLLEELEGRGVRVLLPVLTQDLDLDWATYTGPTHLESRRMGLLEPTGPPLGENAIALADAVLIPGLAVDTTGIRLGRGAGCYDRVLGRVAPAAFVCVLLHDGEVRSDPVPSDPQDRRVAAVATPSGLIRFATPSEAKPGVLPPEG